MVRKEFVVEEVQRLMSNIEQIRNVAIVAHVDHGKCISGDARLYLANGRVVKAKDLYAEIIKLGKLVRSDKDEEVYEADGTDCFSLNKETTKIETTQITHGWRLKGGRLLKVTLKNGAEIATTPEHKYIVLQGMKFVDKKAGEIQVGDALVCPKKLQVKQCDNIKEKILQMLGTDSFYVHLTSEIVSEISEELENKNIDINKLKELLKTNLSVDRLKFCFYKNRFRAKDFFGVCELLAIPLELAYGAVESVSYSMESSWRSKSCQKITLPQNFENLFSIAGLMFGSGDGRVFVTGKSELGEKFTAILKSFGSSAYHREYPRKTKEIGIRSKTLLHLLKVLFGYKAKKKSQNIYGTNFLFTAPNNYVAAFLQAYFDCDGTVEFGRRAISISSASDMMLRDVQALLLRFNCASIIHGNTLYIQGNSVKRFNEQIGFSLIGKMNKAKELEKRASGSYVLDVIPLSGEAFLELKGNASMTSISSNYYEYAGRKTCPVISSVSKLATKLNSEFLTQLSTEELAFIEVTGISEEYEEEVYDFTVENTHNFVADGMFIHNTTLTDSLVARAGLISKELAGEQRMMDFDEQEQARGITIKSANISLGFNFDGKDYLINLIDTPGHVDFGFHVTRAMRAVDGVCLVVDSVEGVMPQTETNLRQALKERAKPILFINKIDRLINELKLDSKQMQERFTKIILQVNKIINASAPPDKKEEWTISVNKGNVAFGTAFNKWALSITSMKKFNISFKDIYEKCVAEDHKYLVDRSPLDEVLLEMIILHLPNPKIAQSYRIPVLWKNGDLNSEHGKTMLVCDSSGKVVGVVFGIVYDEHAGEVGVVRLFSGSVEKGTQLYISSKKTHGKVQQVGIYMGPDRVSADKITAGNIGAVVGLKDVYVGETVSTDIIEPFEQIKHYSEPVITKSIEAKEQKDLPKLIEALRGISKEDPTIKIELNQETGEHLMSGNGELHLEIIEYKITKEKGINIITSPPLVVYRETVNNEGPEVEGKSPNKHNRLKVYVEPLSQEVVKAMDEGIIPEGRPKGKELVEKLVSVGFDRDEAKNIYDICNKNIFVNATKGIQYLNEVEELLVQGFEEAMSKGPLAKEKVTGVKVVLTDALLHEDNVHRGPAQMLPTIKRPIYASMLLAGVTLLEPKQKVLIQTLQEYAGDVINMTNGRRGQLLGMEQEGENATINTILPVSEMFGFSNNLRGVTQGRAIWYQEYAGYHLMPRELVAKNVKQIRERKGDKPEPPTPQDFLDA